MSAETKTYPSGPTRYRNGHGGARPNSGRKRNDKTKSAQSLRDRFPVMPLEHMLTILNTPHETKERKDEMARAAAPYVHPRLAAIELTGRDRGPIRHSLDVTKLTDEELAMFEKIMAKASVASMVLDSDDPEDMKLLEAPNLADDPDLVAKAKSVPK